MRRKKLTENPFSLIKDGSQVNRERLAFVETSTIQTLVDSITDPEWRLCIALARWGWVADSRRDSRTEMG